LTNTHVYPNMLKSKVIHDIIHSNNFESCRAKSRDNMDSPLVYLKKYAITDGPVSFIILSE
ncbi:hypothetical protein T06_4134, partial [Trichinella sp. T6]